MEQIKILPLTAHKKLQEKTYTTWLLGNKDTYTIGRSQGEIKADLDCFFDKSLSGLQAVILKKVQKWHIMDISKSGTWLNGKKLLPGEQVPIKEYDRINLGKSAELLLISASKETVFWKNICLVIDLTSCLNYALLYSGLPLLKGITLYNCSKTPSRPFIIEVAIEQYYRTEYRIPGLKKGTGYTITNFGIYPELFPDQVGRFLFSIKAERTLIFRKTIQSMSFNTWLKTTDPFACTSLASFVLPNHTYVKQISEKIRTAVKKQGIDTLTPENPAAPCEAVYCYLKEQWHIVFKEEQPGLEYNAQAIRLPHHILYDWENKTGEGNCLDLSLLISSCLENLRFCPVLVILEMNRNLWHCLVGVRKESVFDPRPLIREKKDITQEFLLLDPNSLTADIDFTEAVNRGKSLLESRTFLFGIDVRAAREYDIRPLPFEAIPRESPVVIQLLINVKHLAETIHTEYKVCTTIHLLIAMLGYKEGFVHSLFRTLNIDIEKAIRQLSAGLRNIEADKKVEHLLFSRNYQLLLPRALAIAKEKKSLFIMEEHLFLSLLELQSTSLERALYDLGIDKESLRLKVIKFLKDESSPAVNDVKSFYNNREKKLFFF